MLSIVPVLAANTSGARFRRHIDPHVFVIIVQRLIVIEPVFVGYVYGRKRSAEFLGRGDDGLVGAVVAALFVSAAARADV